MTEESFVEISATVFQNFNQGGIVEVAIPQNKCPCIDDVFWWVYAQYTGLARVEGIIRFDGNVAVCRISKIN